MSEHINHPRHTIYVVDNDAAVRDGLSALLSPLPALVKTYASGEALLQQAPTTTAQHCLIAEVHLSGMNGLELMQHLQDRGIPIPVILLASHSDVPTAVQAMRAGAVDFIDKPFVDRVLLQRVRQCLQDPY